MLSAMRVRARAAPVAIVVLTLGACLPSTHPQRPAADAAAMGRHLVRLAVEAHGGRAAWDAATTLRARYREEWWVPFAWFGQSPWDGTSVDGQLTLWLHQAQATLEFPGGQWAWSPQGTSRTGQAPRGGDPAYALPRTHYLMLLPFKLMDPGVQPLHLGTVEHQGHTVDRLWVTFAAGVGASSGDQLWVDLDARTHRLRRVFLTVTAYHPLAFGEVLFERPIRVGPLWFHQVIRARYPGVHGGLPLHTSLVTALELR